MCLVLRHSMFLVLLSLPGLLGHTTVSTTNTPIALATFSPFHPSFPLVSFLAPNPFVELLQLDDPPCDLLNVSSSQQPSVCSATVAFPCLHPGSGFDCSQTQSMCLCQDQIQHCQCSYNLRSHQSHINIKFTDIKSALCFPTRHLIIFAIFIFFYVLINVFPPT